MKTKIKAEKNTENDFCSIYYWVFGNNEYKEEGKICIRSSTGPVLSFDTKIIKSSRNEVYFGINIENIFFMYFKESNK